MSTVAFDEELEALQSMYYDIKVTKIEKDVSSDVTECLSTTGKELKTLFREGKNILSDKTSSEEIEAHVRVQLSCKPRSSSTSFVTAQIEILTPNLYPNARSSFKILKSSGLSDEGKGIEALVRNFINETPLGEFLLFQLIDLVHDFLDNSNVAECLICAEELTAFDPLGSGYLFSPTDSKSWDKESYGLRTSCYHCFHIHCLTRWAAISLSLKNFKKDEKAWFRERDVNIIRNTDGLIRSTEVEIEGLHAHMINLLKDIIETESKFLVEQQQQQQHQLQLKEKPQQQRQEKKVIALPKNLKKSSTTIINSTNNNNNKNENKDTIDTSIDTIAAVRLSIKDLRLKLSPLVLETQEAKSRTDKNKLSEKANKLRKLLINEDTKLDLMEQQQGEGMVPELKTVVVLEKLKMSLKCTEDKITRDEKKLTANREDLSQAKMKVNNKLKENDLNLSFPCPCCRTDLSAVNCNTENPCENSIENKNENGKEINNENKENKKKEINKEINPFNLYLNKAIMLHERERREDRLENEREQEEKPPGLGFGSTLSTELTLSPRKEKIRALRFPSYPKSVLNLPRETLMFVRDVQKQQQECWNNRKNHTYF